MHFDEVVKSVRVQTEAARAAEIDWTDLDSMLVTPKQISVITRTARNGEFQDDVIPVWLIGQERSANGYRIVMRNDGSSFGLASSGFPSDKHLILCGWYGELANTFKSM